MEKMISMRIFIDDMRWNHDSTFLFGDLWDGIEDMRAILQIVFVVLYFLCFLYLFFEKLFVHCYVVF